MPATGAAGTGGLAIQAPPVALETQHKDPGPSLQVHMMVEV